MYPAASGKVRCHFSLADVGPSTVLDFDRGQNVILNSLWFGSGGASVILVSLM